MFPLQNRREISPEMSNFFNSPPDTTVNGVGGGSTTPAAVITQIPQQTPFNPAVNAETTPSSSSTSSIVIVVIVIASAVIVSASIYLILRLLSKRFHRSSRTFSAADEVVLHRGSSTSAAAANASHCHMPANGLLDSLPLFSFGSVAGNLTGGDCAVCLSRFEPHDQLRLLPLCCHAFHARCIDTWLVSNQTCPLCRSTVLAADSDALNKILSADSNRNGNEEGDGSFRVEIGSISRRHSSSDTGGEGGRRSYSIGSFEYIVDDGYEVSVGSTTHRRGPSDWTLTSGDKDSSFGVPPPGEILAREVSNGRNWLRDYVDRLGSMSFRSSGRFFSGSSRRSETVVPVDDLESNRIGEEISELFRWLSGV